MLADQIKEQKTIEALMKLKSQKMAELKEIDATLRKIIYKKKKWNPLKRPLSTIQPRCIIT